MKINLEKAVQFIDNHGTLFQKSWFNSVVLEKDVSKTLKLIREFQNRDGGFVGIDPDYNGEISSITCTIIALKKLEFLDLKHHYILELIRKYIKSTQTAQGYWDENEGILKNNIRRWYVPNYTPNKIWYTNGLLRYIKSFFPEEKNVIEKAIHYLKSIWSGDEFKGYYHNNFMGIVNFSNWNDTLEYNIYKSCMKNLYNSMENYDYYDLVWAMQSLAFLKNPLLEKIMSKGLYLIMYSQMEDGGFPSKYGMNQRVYSTIESIALLLKCKELKKDEIKVLGE